MTVPGVWQPGLVSVQLWLRVPGVRKDGEYCVSQKHIHDASVFLSCGRRELLIFPVGDLKRVLSVAAEMPGGKITLKMQLNIPRRFSRWEIPGF
jgi:hypothetical protein